MDAMKSSAFITYMILFFSVLIITVLILYGSEILIFFLLKGNYINSKLSSETLSSILSIISSSTYNASLIIYVPPKDLEIFFGNENITVKIKDSTSFSKIFKPNYIKINETKKECPSFFNSLCPIIITKIDNEIEIE
jgi:hypothetical protein